MYKNQNSKVVAIVQARVGSTRLPGKSLMPLAGREMVYRILERIKRARLVDEIILAIPDTKEDDVLALIAAELGVKVFRGSENDVLERYYLAALDSAADYIVRIPADNPVSQPEEIDRIISHHLHLRKPGFSSNLAEVNRSGYPDGIGAEIFDFSLLEKAWQSNFSSEQREHVHLNFFNYETGKAVDDSWCAISSPICPKEFARPDLILDINEREQYEYFFQMYNDLYFDNPEFGIVEIIRWHDSRQNISEREVQL
jgi:spore coat polysaccharide biosynthesis protein SpsF